MKSMFIITGANGHLGNTIIRSLIGKNLCIRGLILPGDQFYPIPGVEYIEGDVRNKESLRNLFKGSENYDTYVIHTAGIIDISEKISPLLYDVNVNGTKNIISLCLEYNVKRLVYVSSVHAIPEKDSSSVIAETGRFSPSEVVGGYAKTKAEATQAVLDAAAAGLNAVIVHPSGILGPYGGSENHLVQLLSDYICGRIPACVRGGYDFVDVRDVADGCILALKKGVCGECYILSNRHYEIKDVLKMVKSVYGGRRLPVLPMWLAKIFIPVFQLHSKIFKKRPLYTKYSLYTLKSNDRFSHDKATAELGYKPRDLLCTIKDTIDWICANKRKPSMA